MEKIDISLQQTIDLLPDGVLIVDEQGRILMVNTQLGKLFGYGPQELPGQMLNVLVPDRYHQVHKGHLTEYHAHPSVRTMGAGKALFGKRKDGTEFDVAIALSPVDIGNKKVTISTIRDITEKMDLDRAMAWKNEQLGAINTELERFGFTVSHDLKSPLANIQAIIHLITREIPAEKKEALSEHLYQLNQTLYSMSELISGIAAYSKATLADAITGVEIDTNKLMLEVRNLTLMPPNSTLEIAEHMPVTWGNKTKLLQVFLNIISNAIKYNDKEAVHIKVSGQLTYSLVHICIDDNGPGIAPELREKVFTLFEKGGSKRSDSQGIGLAIVAKVIHEMKGSIVIEDSPLGGARFKIELPIVPPPAFPTTPGTVPTEK